MATKKLSDYLQTTLPAAGGFQIANSTPATMIKPVAAPAPVLSPLSRLDLTNVGKPPVVGITNQNVLPPQLRTPVTAPAPVVASPVPTSPLFAGGGSNGGSAAPVVPPAGAPAAAPAANVPASWKNADGTYKTAEQIAQEAGAALRTAHENPDVGTLALQQFGADHMTTEQAIAQARKIGNTRNDIAVGETDPYKVASDSGIAYTPAELKAIENAYAGVYDPALDTALAKVKTKQDADKAAADQASSLAQIKAQQNAPYTLGKDDVRYDSEGNPIAVGIPSSTSTSGGIYTRGANPVVDSYVDYVKANPTKLTDVPKEYQDLVVQGISAAGAAALSKNTVNAISNIDAILASGKLDDITGISSLNPLLFLPGSDAASTLNMSKQLKGILSLENRTQLKGSGAISDFEFRVLGDAASALGIKDNGTTNLSKEQFQTELNKMKLKLQVGETNLTDDELVHLQDQGYTPDQIRAYSQSQSFSSAGNASASNLSLNRPQRNNNPGNVKAGGSSDSLAIGVDEQGHLKFPDAATGFRALTNDVSAKISGNSKYLPANPTIAQLGKVYAEDPNWPKKVAAMIGVPVDTHTQMVPLANLVKAIATQEGFYA